MHIRCFVIRVLVIPSSYVSNETNFHVNKMFRNKCRFSGSNNHLGGGKNQNIKLNHTSLANLKI